MNDTISNASFDTLYRQTIVEAHTEYGYVLQYIGRNTTHQPHYFASEEAAEAFVARIKGKEYNMRHWVHIRTIYGSRAYVENDVELQVVSLEREADLSGDYSNLFKCM